MKWLVVVLSLFVYGQLSAAGLCIKNDDGEFTNNCIVGWNGATDYIAYAGALSAMLDKFTSAIFYDSFENQRNWFGVRCRIEPGVHDADPPEAPTGCTARTLTEESKNISLATSFQRTLETADPLIDELSWTAPALQFRNSSYHSPRKNDKSAACNTMMNHLGIAPLWTAFASSFQQDYDAYNDPYRKKIFKHWFQAIKRLYGFYANRMKRLSRNIKREYRCEV